MLQALEPGDRECLVKGTGKVGGASGKGAKVWFVDYHSTKPEEMSPSSG